LLLGSSAQSSCLLALRRQQLAVLHGLEENLQQMTPLLVWGKCQ